MRASDDAIHIEALAVDARVGVPEAERAEPQRLELCITLWPIDSFDQLRDDLANAVDYATVADATREFVASRCDKLIETLASAVAAHLLESFAIRAARIELRKFVIPDSEYVAAIVTRERTANGSG